MYGIKTVTDAGNELDDWRYGCWSGIINDGLSNGAQNGELRFSSLKWRDFDLASRRKKRESMPTTVDCVSSVLLEQCKFDSIDCERAGDL